MIRKGLGSTCYYCFRLCTEALSLNFHSGRRGRYLQRLASNSAYYLSTVCYCFHGRESPFATITNYFSCSHPLQSNYGLQNGSRNPYH